MHYRWDENRLFLNCNITPRSDNDSITGVSGDYLKIRITQAPTDGKANKHLIRYLSKQFGVKQNAITIVNGAGSRKKCLCIESPAHLPEWINEEY